MHYEEPSRTQKRIVTIPNLLSLFRLFLIPLLIWLYCVKQKSLWTGGILLLSGITDVVDGYIARRYHMTSDVGKILDPIADKATQAAMLYCLLSRFPLMLAPLVLLLMKDIFVGATAFMVIQKRGIVFGAKWHGKVATCLLYTMMFVHIVWDGIPVGVSNFSIILCFIMMVISLVLYGARNVNALLGVETER